MMKIKDNKQGIILVLTLIIMAVLLSVAIGFGTLVITDIRQAKAVDDSMVAYFAADAGIEQNLFLLRRQDNIASRSDIVSTTAVLAPSGSGWTTASSTSYEPNYFRQRIRSGQSVKLFFLDRPTNKVKSILVDWEKGVGSTAKMQITLTQLELNQSGSDGDIFLTDLSEVRVATGTANCFKLANASSDYVAEIKALGSSDDDYIQTLRVRSYDDESCLGAELADAITNTTLVSEGIYNNSRQRIIASIPARAPALGILNFVLFSEEDITKR